MTSKFREALDDLNMCLQPQYSNRRTVDVEDLEPETPDVIRQALLIAERLESGYVSEKMEKTGREEIKKDYRTVFPKYVFKAMAKVMIEEVKDEKI